MSLQEFLTSYLGEWLLEYPYILAVYEIVLIIIMLIFLYNFCYWLIRLLGGDR